MNLLLAIGVAYAFLILVVFIKKDMEKTIKTLAWIVVVLEGVFLSLRWVEAGHPPLTSTFDEGVLASFFLMLYSTSFDKKQHFVRFFVPFAFISFLYGFLYYDAVRPIIPTEDGISVYFHVFFVWLSYFFYTLAFVASIVCLKGKNIFGTEVIMDNLEVYIHRNILYGMVFQTIMFVLGAYHSAFVFGNWWVWDPVVFLCLLSWFIFAVAIHGSMFRDWDIKVVSRWVILGFASIMLLYWGLVYINFATFHIFDLSLKSH